ncbi:MAG TPA: HAD-IA family hydrolase [Pseudonocardiaceae bacterium]
MRSELTGVRAHLFDLDGVLTSTAEVHAAAWREMFDAFLAARGERPFDPAVDYPRYLDGRLRADGTRAFLASRGITLPDGEPDDPPDRETVQGLGNRKNELVLAALRSGRLDAYPGAVRFLDEVRGAPCAVVSSSTNCRPVLESIGLVDRMDVVVDGLVAHVEGLAGKPAPDMFVHAARKLGVEPHEAAVYEDALSGVAAGHAGGFAVVVGVDRAHQRQALLDVGATLVVDDLGELAGDGSGDRAGPSDGTDTGNGVTG